MAEVMRIERVFKTSSIMAGIAAIFLCSTQIWAQDLISYEGEDGFRQSFTLSGGQYKLYVYARDPILGELPPGFEHCTFTGSLERMSPPHDSISLGRAVKISQKDWTPWRIDREIHLASGQYQLVVLSVTDCRWTFNLELKSGEETSELSSAPISSMCFLRSCVMPPIALSVGALKDSARTVSLRAESVEFVAPFVRWDHAVAPSGTCLIKMGDKTLKQLPLQVDEDPVSHHDQFYVVHTWDRNLAPPEGNITVEFVTSLGSSRAEFQLTH